MDGEYMEDGLCYIISDKEKVPLTMSSFIGRGFSVEVNIDEDGKYYNGRAFIPKNDPLFDTIGGAGYPDDE